MFGKDFLPLTTVSPKLSVSYIKIIDRERLKLIVDYKFCIVILTIMSNKFPLSQNPV